MLPALLKEKKIIIKMPHDGKRERYKWNSIRPNLKMVEQLRADIRNKAKEKSAPVESTCTHEPVKPKRAASKKGYGLIRTCWYGFVGSMKRIW